MLLRNYYNYMAMMHFDKLSSASSFGDGFLSLKNTSGSLTYPYASSGSWSGYSPCSIQNLLTSSSYHSYGSGVTAVTYEDYKLENEITSGISKTISNTDPVYNAETKKWSSTIAHTIINTSSNLITINEIGTSGRCSSGTALVYRTVLDTPITIAAGSAATITFTLEYQMPTAA